MNPSNNWGGKRKGSGRPPTGRKARTYRLTDEEHEILKEHLRTIREIKGCK